MTRVSRERWPLILGLWAAPVSIAVSESFLSMAAVVQLVKLARRRARFRFPRCLWCWLAWAVLEVLLWARSPEPALGWGEIRHLLLLAVLFLTLSGFDRPRDLRVAWEGVFVTASVSSLVLIGHFFVRLRLHGEQIAAGGDAAFYLRSGGLLSHWMVYATVEIVVVAGLLGYWSAYGNARRYLWPVTAINAAAVVLSLTRMAWITCLFLLGIHLAWKRSRWVWALPLLPLVLYGLAPGAVRQRAADFVDLAYYSNAERLQMIEVGWEMMRDHPLTGVGPGRVEKLYESYLTSGEPVPAYHGHLHNNVAQLAAQFGIPVTAAALAFVFFALRDLLKARSRTVDPDGRFLADTGALALAGFVFAGLFEYTYGHSLGLIMIAFAVVPPLLLLQSR